MPVPDYHFTHLHTLHHSHALISPSPPPFLPPPLHPPPPPPQGGCIIRAVFLDDIKKAYDRNPQLPSLLVDPDFGKKLVTSAPSWRRVVGLAVANGVPVPGMSASLAYYDTYRRERLPANLVQAQRDFFGSHTYQRTDDKSGAWFHTVSDVISFKWVVSFVFWGGG